MSKKHNRTFEALAAEFQRLRSNGNVNTFDKEIASYAGKRLAHGDDPRAVLKDAIAIDKKRAKPIGKASVEYTVKWVLQKQIEKGDG